jgi:hypothetical protein
MCNSKRLMAMMMAMTMGAMIAMPLAAQAPATAPATAAPPANTQPPDDTPVRKQEVFVRRLSGGISVSASLPGPTLEENLHQSFANTPPLEIFSKTSSKSSMLGFGAVVQLAVTDHWAVAAAPMLRTSIKFEAEIQRLVGNDNPNTIQDDREGTILQSKTSARLFDLPILGRYYTKSRRESGFRAFLEAGPRFRTAYAVRTNTHVTPPPNHGVQEPYDLTDPISYRKRITGASAGFGLQFIDDFGIRFVPEVRYTRWFGKNFGDITSRSRQHQVEIIFTLSF